MKNFKKTIIFAAAGLILLGAAVAALMLTRPDEDAETEPEQLKGTMIDEKLKTVESVEFTPADGRGFTIVIVDEACDMLEKSDVFPYSDVYLSSTADYSFSQVNVPIITQEATAAQLSDFGFDRPQLKWRVNRTDGTFAEFELGVKNEAGDFYYARESESGTVYSISSSAGRAMLKKEYEYFELKLITTYVDEQYEALSFAKTMTYLKLSLADDQTIEFRKRSEEEMTGAGITASAFRMLSPYEAEANDYQVDELLAAKIGTISPSKTLGPADDLVKYGLDRPVRLELEDQEGWSTVLLIGGIDPVTEGRYITVEGSKYVLLDPYGDYSFLKVNPLSLRNGIMWLEDIVGISEIVYNLNGVKRVLTLDITDDGESAELDGIEISALNGKRLYARTVELVIDGESTTTPNVSPQYEIEIRLRDGGTRTMRLHRLNDRQYKIELDGVMEDFYVGITRIQRLLEGFDIADSGGDIPW